MKSIFLNFTYILPTNINSAMSKDLWGLEPNLTQHTQTQILKNFKYLWKLVAIFDIGEIVVNLQHTSQVG